MPNSKINRRGPESAEKNRKGKALSFHGRIPMSIPAKELRRPKTQPNLEAEKFVSVGVSPESRPKLTKLLLKVTIQGSVGAVQVVMSLENTVGDLIASAVRQYSKEARRPILPSTDPSRFDLHYSQFSLERLQREGKLMELGSRNFFLCPNKVGMDGGDGTTFCSKEAGKVSKSGIPWLKFMDFLF